MRRQPVVSISHNASRGFCTMDTSSLYVTNKHHDCGKLKKFPSGKQSFLLVVYGYAG